ncbi:outer membrane protein [Natronocella acetinitrilica]|uniref:Outer membrane protein n=1 Tax=Natronocella acetinitrilica TaxID=414046 RepID=A0AAE3G8L8_9GAMM|nr:MipA/OmpV family protein [Natronocella acetinitrilica]MCP1677024.1 outer membrane protein [Natronocella acetinitrilica]
MQQRSGFIAVVVLLAGLGFGGATAQANPPERGGWSAGMGVVASSRPYPGSSSDVTGIPFIGYEGRRAYLRGLVAGVRQPGPGSAEFDLFLRARMQRYNQSDAPVVEGMDSRRRTAEAGVGVSVGPPWLRGDARLATDILGRHDGQELTLSLSNPQRVGQTLVRVFAGGSWQSADLTGYYYGVRRSEEREGRPAYRPGAAWNWRAGVFLQRRFAGRWSGVAVVQHEWLDDNLRRSPIVDGNRRWFVLAAATYSF